MTEPEHKHVDGKEGDEDHGEEIEEESVEEEREEEEKGKEQGEGEKEEEEEEENEGDEKPVKKRRCQGRKKIIRVCFDDESYEDEEDFDLLDDEEEEEEGEEDEEEEWDVSSVSSILSAVSFIWEDEVYEFEELCDMGTFDTVCKQHISEPEVLDEFGTQRYLQMCNSLNISPMASILRSLPTEEIDLSYRNMDNKAIRATCAALESNSSIKRLFAKWNNLRSEDCRYLGRVLGHNTTISHLDFTGSRLGPDGVGFLVSFLTNNETVVDLILSKCYILDEGMKNLAYVLSLNNSIENLDLSYNKLESGSGDALASVFMSTSSLMNLNLRYNNLFYPSSMKNFFRYLGSNYSIINLDLSWNGMNGEDMGTYIGNFLKKNKTISTLDLSDNRFEGMAVLEIKRGLAKSRSLTTLKLGKNPLSPEDIVNLLSGAKACSTLKVLDLEDLWINATITKTLKKLQKEREFEFKYAGILSNYEIHGPDYPKLILRRAQFEAQKPKAEKKKRDFGHLIWTLGDEPLTKEDFMKQVKKFKAKINKQLFPELINQFTNPKLQLIDVVAMRKKYLSIFPDSTPPPPPKPKGKKGKQPVEEQTEVPPEEAAQEESQFTLGESAEELFLDGEEEEYLEEGAENQQ